MRLPLQISFRRMEPSDEIGAIIREKAVKLDTFATDIMRCRVMVEPAGKHYVHGNLCEERAPPKAVWLEPTVKGDEP